MHTQQDSDAALQNNLTISEKSVVPYTHSSGYAIASLILGIISSALACVPILSTICSILGIVFVIKVRKQEKVFHNGLVTAGLILCICGFVLSLLFLLIGFGICSSFSVQWKHNPIMKHRRRCQNIMDIRQNFFCLSISKDNPIIFSSL